MTDIDLFAYGCGTIFFAFAGAYTFVRGRYLDGSRREAGLRDAEEGASASLAASRDG
jgi:hypothetical protein